MPHPKQKRPAAGDTAGGALETHQLGGDEHPRVYRERPPAATLVLRCIRDEAGRFQGLEAVA